MSHILCTGPLNDYATELLSRQARLEFTASTSEDELLEKAEGAIAIVARGSPPISAAVIISSPSLRVIARAGVGYETIDVAAANARNIPVIHTPGALTRSVAEAAVTFMLVMCKQVLYWDRQCKRGNWESRYDSRTRDLEGATLGIIGFGRIGRSLAGLARGFNMNILAHDPCLDQTPPADMNVRLVDLDTLLASSDFISLHCAETPQNRGLIDRTRLQQVKRGSYFINLARGGLIKNLDILLEALDDGRLNGVALDVFDPEPPDISHPLFRHEKCITTPHTIGASRTAVERTLNLMAEDVVAVLRGDRPRFAVNPEVFDSQSLAESAGASIVPSDG